MYRIIGSGFGYRHPGGISIDRSRGVDFWVFLHTTAPYTLTCGEEVRESEGPSFLLLRSGIPYRLVSDSPDYADDWIHFLPSGDTDQVAPGLLPFESPIGITDDREILPLMRYFDREFRHSGSHREMILDHCLRVLFAKVSDLYSEEQSCPDSLRGHRAALLELRQSIFQSGQPPQLSVAEIAARMNLSVSYMQHLYKALFGASIKQDLIRARIEHACHLLRDDTISVSEAALACGYQSTEHFIRQFARMEGCSPKQYQLRIAGRETGREMQT